MGGLAAWRKRRGEDQEEGTMKAQRTSDEPNHATRSNERDDASTLVAHSSFIDDVAVLLEQDSIEAPEIVETQTLALSVSH